MNAIGAGPQDYNRDSSPASAGTENVVVVLLRSKWQILLTFFAITACVVVITLLTPKAYESRMKILLKNERPDMVVSPGSAQASQPGEVSETEINTEIELLNNNDLLQQVAKACGLNRLNSRPGVAIPGAALENAVRTLRRDLSIAPVRKANIIEVKYTARNAHQAVAVLRQLSQDYLEAHLRLHGNPGTYEFYLAQTEQYGAQLKDAEARLTEFRQKHNVLLFPEQKEDVVRKESEAGAMLQATQASIREHNQRLSIARVQLTAADPRIITQNRTLYNQSSVEHLSTMLVDLQNKRTELLTKFKPDDRSVLQLSQQITDTQVALDKARNVTGTDQTTDVNPVRQTLELEIAKERDEEAGMEARRDSLAQQVSSYRVTMERMSSATADYENLMRNRKEAEDNYMLYRHKTEEARITDSLDRQKIGNIAIAENPVEPQAPSKPNVPQNIFLGALMAALVSVGTAWLTDYVRKPAVRPVLDDTRELYSAATAVTHRILGSVERSSDLEALTGLPVFVVIRK